MKYERLTKNGSNYATCDGEHDIIVKFSEDGSEEPIYDFDSICVKLNRLAELEDKIESGKMLELPCKVGDILYAIMDVDYKMQLVKFRATNIELGTDGEIYFNTPTCYSRKLTFGKSVFADKSQAEARLKELQGVDL